MIEADGSNIALDFVNSLSGFWDIGHEDQLEKVLRLQLTACDAAFWKALSHLTSRPYWTRLWVIQEQLMGTENILVLCGDRIMHWEDFRHIFFISTLE